MEKALKNYTIIPPSFYVKRSADRQLKTIIDEMGRPGYVLVSRQMGKTNLLLNAKREFEDESTIFVYVDLSNQFETSRDCFRNIIDVALNSHFKHFKDAVLSIHKPREAGQHIPPNTEHESELLKLLRWFHGKVVIILDEVDALTSSNFSDVIFAQIRSVYFAGRTNYPEFSRLTYILSGVAEPSSLIKDKNKSPFNIGDKIYLDDFNYNEFSLFVEKLAFSAFKEAIGRVFEWTNGHPRMTWDLCSKLEDKFIENHTLTCADVDSSVFLLFTKDFDHAPVDHIRDLVQNNYEIRKAVRSLINGDNDIADNLKTSLYLAGIIKSDYNVNSIVTIKNNIISACLKIEWLDSIDVINKSYFNLACEQETIGKYDEAIKYYKLHLEHHSGSDSISKGIVLSTIGNCYYAIGKFEDALEYLLKSKEEKTTKVRGYSNLNDFRLGLTYLRLGALDNSLEIFDVLRKNDKLEDNLKYKATLNYVTVLLQIASEDNKSEILGILYQLSDTVSNDENIDTEFLNEILILTYYNIATIHSMNKDSVKAAQNFQKSIDIGAARYKPFLYLCLIQCLDDIDIVVDCIQKSTKVITDNTLKYRKYLATTNDSLDLMEFNEHILNDHFILLYQYNCNDSLVSLRQYYLDNIDRQSNVISFAKHILKVATEGDSTKVILKVSEELVTYYTSNTSTDKVELLKLHRRIGNIKHRLKLDFYSDLFKYVNLFDLNDDLQAEIEYEDIISFTLIALHLRSLKKYYDIIKICKIIAHYYDRCPDNIKINFVGIYYLISSASVNIKNKSDAILYAQKSIQVASKHSADQLRIVGIQQLDDIVNSCTNIIQSSVLDEFFTGKRLGRNDQCYCGSGLKYKKCHGK